MAYGQIYLKRNAPWIDDFRAEIVAFPFGVNDDQVDAFSQLVINKTKVYCNTLEKINKLVEYTHSEEHKVYKYMLYKKLGLNKLF